MTQRPQSLYNKTMEFNLKYSSSDVEEIATQFRDAIKKLREAQTWAQPPKSAAVMFATMYTPGLPPKRWLYPIVGTGAESTLSAMVVVRIGLNDDRETGGYMLSDWFNNGSKQQAYLQAVLDKVFWDEFPKQFGDKILKIKR